MSERVEITVNGQLHTVAAQTTIADLIRKLGYGDRPVAVERNREVVPRATHQTCIVEQGDELEVVTFVGGG